MLCSVEGCNKGNIMARGLCPSHYKRNLKYGDPQKGNTFKGDVVKEIEKVLKSETDECIFSNYSRNKAGYPRVRIKGKTKLLHRHILEIYKGSPIEVKMEAAHSCGNGHLGCINPKHLDWKSKISNVDDSIKHGTKHTGDKNFSFEDITKMRKLLSKNVSPFIVSNQFKISPSYLNKIRLYKVRKYK